MLQLSSLLMLDLMFGLVTFGGQHIPISILNTTNVMLNSGLGGVFLG